MTAYAELESRFRRLSGLAGAEAVLHWDWAVMMPPGGAEARGEQLAVLSGLAHELLTAPDLGGLLDQAEGESGNLDDWQRANLAEMSRRWRHATALDAALVEALARAATACEMTWREARAADDFAPVDHHVTEAEGQVDSFTFAQLRSLDAGYDWSPADDGSHPFRGQGLLIPTLDEVLSEFAGQHMVIELKTADAEAAQQLCGELRRHAHEERAIVAAFAPEALTNFRQACPEVATSASSAEMSKYWILHLLRLDVLSWPEFEALQVPETLGPLTIVDERFVDVSQGRGLPVQVWTIDDEETMGRLFDLGVQAIMTRRPDQLARLLAARGQR